MPDGGLRNQGSDADAVVQLYTNTDPPPDALAFAFWSIPGQKHLIHDGDCLGVLARWPGCCLRLVIAPGLEEDGIRLCHPRLRHTLRPLSGTGGGAGQARYRWRRLTCGNARPRPTLTKLLESNTFQALDGTLAGASLREVAEGLANRKIVALASDWHLCEEHDGRSAAFGRERARAAMT